MNDTFDRITNLSESKRALFESRLHDSPLARFVRPRGSPNEGLRSPAGIEIPTPTGEADTGYPITIRADSEKTSLNDWITRHKSWVLRKVLDTGAVLLRGFLVRGAGDFERCIESVWGDTSTYPGFAQSVVVRTRVSGKIYTSTEYSPDFAINLHNECSFANSWPAQISFYCTEAPAVGGETPIADTRRILRRISKGTVDRLRKLGISYVRNFGNGASRSWESAFSTRDRAEVVELCRADGITCEWLVNGNLRTRAVRPPVEKHPVTNELVWFNHIHASHISSLEPDLRGALVSQYGREGLPRNCYYGDGSDFGDDVIREIQDAYRAETATFEWRPGDVLMLDNMLTAHGRLPFKGPRKVLVGMSGSIRRSAT